MRFERILAASDLRAEPDLALINGQRLAAATGAELHVFHCIQDGGASSAATGSEPQDVLSRRAPGAVSSEVGDGVPYRAINGRAAQVGAHVIVLGPQVRRPAASPLLGNTSDRVLRTSRVPCLLSNEEMVAEPARIVIAVDATEHSRRAVRTAPAPAAATPNSKETGRPRAVHLLHVSAFASPGRARAPDLAGLAELVEGVRLPDVSISHSVYSAPFADEGIVVFCDEFQPDLVVLGTHGHGPFVRALVGGVALEVARTLHAPLLVVPRP
jgi:universal stress protein E